MTSAVALAGMLALLVGGGVGVPVPEDVTLVGAGLLARAGTITLWQGVVAGIAGVCAADWIVYLAGRRWGTAVLTHPFIARVVPREQLASVETLVRRHGARAVFVARFVLGTRMATFLSAGAFGVPAVAFGIAEAAGTTLFATAMVTLGYLFAHQADRVMADVEHAEHWLVLGGLGALIAMLAVRAVATRWVSAPRHSPEE